MYFLSPQSGHRIFLYFSTIMVTSYLYISQNSSLCRYPSFLDKFVRLIWCIPSCKSWHCKDAPTGTHTHTHTHTHTQSMQDSADTGQVIRSMWVKTNCRPTWQAHYWNVFRKMYKQALCSESVVRFQRNVLTSGAHLDLVSSFSSEPWASSES